MDEGSNVVVLFPGALGDLVLAMPALAALRARRLGAHLTLAVAGWLRALVATSGIADTTVSLDDADAAGLFGGSRWPAWFGHRPEVHSWIGSRDPAVGERLRAVARRVELHAVVRGEGDEHAASAYARQIGLSGAVPPYRWPAPAPSVGATDLDESVAHAVLAMHPGAGSPAKRWARDGFAAVARRWRDAGGDVVELVGPADLDVASIGVGRRLVDWPLIDVAAVLGRADAYVGNDAGISHLAGALDVPGVAVFGPTSGGRWAPYRGAIDALQAKGRFVDGIDAHAVTPVEVWDALARRGCLDKLQGRA